MRNGTTSQFENNRAAVSAFFRLGALDWVHN